MTFGETTTNQKKPVYYRIPSLTIRAAIAILVLLQGSSFAKSVDLDRFNADTERRQQVTCQEFLKRTRGVRAALLKWQLNIPLARRAIKSVSGGRFDGGEVRGIPAAPVIPQTNPDGTPKKQEDPSLVLVRGWFTTYDAYPEEMNTLIRGIGRYAGEPPAVTATSPDRDPQIDSIREKGRIALLHDIRDRILKAQKQKKADPNYSLSPEESFPLEVNLPRAPSRIGKQATPDEKGSVLATETITDFSDLIELIKNDEYELQVYMQQAVLREMKQAELWMKIGQFRNSFSDEAVKKLATLDATESVKNEKLILIRKADRILNGKEPIDIARRPTDRSSQRISELADTKRSGGILQARHWEIETRRYLNLATGWATYANKKSTEIRNQFLLFAGLATTFGLINSKLQFMHNQIEQLTAELRLSQAELARRAEISDAAKVRSTIGVPAKTYEDLFLGLNNLGQERFDDASVTIAWQYYLGLREDLKPSKQLDPELDPKMYDIFESQARKFWNILMAQEHGLVDENHKTLVPATSPRIPRRELNMNLAKAAAERASRMAKRLNGWDRMDPRPRAPSAPQEGPVVVPSAK